MNGGNIFSKGALLTAAGGGSALVPGGHIYIGEDAGYGDMLAAINLAAKLGFESTGFTPPLVRVYKDGADGDGLYINCGKDGGGAYCLRGDAMARALELCAGGYTDKSDADGAAAFAKAGADFDLSGAFGTAGFTLDLDGDFEPDFMDLKIFAAEGMTAETACTLGDIAAKLGLMTTGMAFPVTTGDRGRASLLVYEPAGDSIRLADENGGKALYINGRDAADYFVRSFPALEYNGVQELGDLKKAVAGLDPNAKVETYEGGREIFSIERDFDWECDKALAIIRDRFSGLSKGDKLRLLVSVSEGPSQREALHKRIAEALAHTGAELDILVISAFKQGLSYFEETLVPFLLGNKNAAKIHIGFKTVQRTADEEWDAVSGAMPIYTSYGEDGKWFDLPIRWLQELYPLDDIIQKLTGFDRDGIVFERLPFDSDPTYTVKVLDKDGETIYQDEYRAVTYEREYLDAFPGTGLVHPHCGFVWGELNGAKALDEKLPTDIDQFWELFQKEVLTRCSDWVREKTGAPAVDRQPFFKCLKFDIKASEPDYGLSIREDRISSLDVLHEDIYFTTLDYFKLFGVNNGGEGFTEPGLILPFIEKREGRGMSVKVTLSDYIEAEKPEKVSFNMDELKIGAGGKLTEVRFGADISDKRLAGLGGAANDIKWNGSVLVNGSRVIDCKYEKPPVIKDLAKWEDKLRTDVIGYDDYIALSAALEGRVKLWTAANSFQNRNILAYEFTEDIGAEVVSRLKLINSRPTFLIVNRHHANEVSSTNSAYTLIFKLLNDPEYADYLRDMNLVIVPFENVDGGALGYELQKQNPNWILHVARFNSVGRDFYHDYYTDAKYGESLGMENILRKWAPDFLADNHGVPSHEWAQPYSGYVSPWFKGFWLPRGIFYGIFDHIDDPESKKLHEAAADYTARELNTDEEIKAVNEELRNRHSKYAHDWMPNMYGQNYRNGLIYYFKAVPPNPSGKYMHHRFPNVCSFGWITEISDETSQGDYMALCSKTHHLADIGIMKLVRDVALEYDRTAVKHEGGLVIKNLRKRPLRYKG